MSTQEASKSTAPKVEIEEGSWGYLQKVPCLNNLVEEPIYFLKDKVITIGRLPSCSIVFAHPMVSGKHLILEYYGIVHGRLHVTITDHGSTNNTWVNHTKLAHNAARLLKHEDEISLVSGIPLIHGQQAVDCRLKFHDVLSPQRAVQQKYTEHGLLGGGASGNVYKANRKSDGRVFAVKHINAAHTRRQYWNAQGETVDLDHLQQQKEIDMLTTLSHPHICQMHDYFWNKDGSLDIVLDYMEGGTLYRLINENKHPDEPGTHDHYLSERMTKHLLRQLCKALAYMHQCGITHRDLKPENILLTRDRPPLLKVADFGLSKLVVNAESVMKSGVGTSWYVSPELVRHKAEGTGYPPLTVDVWGVGLVMYACLAGRYWYYSWPDWDDVAHMDCTINWQPFDEHVISFDEERYPIYVSSQGRTFIRRLLQADPMKRPTMAQVLRDVWFPPDDVDLYTIPTFTPPDDTSRLVRPMRNLSVKAITDDVHVSRDGTPTPTTATAASTLVGAGADVVRRWDVDSAQGLPGPSRQTASPAVKRPRSLELEEEEGVEMDMSPKKKPARGRGGQ